ncbi:MAG: hypothetical protein ABS85_12465 [Sphingobacteriales bacterium SCN 48-20]|jgi:hypothetical protein|nr:MAG: hypothetical protein ABS85_12465 [Sphingobacteriales bacterium SCN 48-20]OJW39996.1 MAG: hypothetical protein BGO56_03800 [Sphingobacteriales bacterium 48-107]
MRKILSERNIAAILFVMVLVVFSIAQSETKKMGIMNAGLSTAIEKKAPASLADQTSKPVSSKQAVN